MQVSVRVSDMIDSYKKFLETKLGVQFAKQQEYLIDQDGKETPPKAELGFIRFATGNEKLPWLKEKI
jgi:hypothetical protein